MNDNHDDISARLHRSLEARGLAPELSSDLVTGASERTAPKLSNPARRLQLAGGATAMVAAVAVGALVVTSPFQQGPLFTSAGSQGGASALNAEDAATSDMKIGSWINYVYEPGAGLSTDGGSGSVYELRRSGTAEERLAQIADAFGLDGSVRESEYSDPSYPTFVVGPEDGSGPSVTVSWSGTGNWYFSNPTAYPVSECDVIPIEGGGGIGSTGSEPSDGELVDPLVIEEPICEYVEPKLEDSLAPREGEARELALEILGATGLDVSAGDIRVTVDAWQTTATANLEVDGTSTALDWTVVWASTGDLAWAYGHSIEVVDRGSFGTVSATDAVERLGDWRWYGSPGPDFQGGMNILAADASRAAESGVVGTETLEVDPTSPDAPVESPPVSEEPGSEPTPAPTTEPGVEPGTDPGVEPLPEPLPEPTVEPEPLPEPLPEPETVVVTVDSAEATLLLMWDSAGNVWLVPGFAMEHPDGWFNAVVSLVDGVIELPEPMVIEPFLEEDVRVEE